MDCKGEREREREITQLKQEHGLGFSELTTSTSAEALAVAMEILLFCTNLLLIATSWFRWALFGIPSSMSQFQLFTAGAPELVRSSQKDRFYAEHIHSLLSESSRQVLPLRWWLGWQRELQLLAEVVYYGLTTVLGNQTLGEEYCNTVQVKRSSENGSGSGVLNRYVVPGAIRRTLAVVLQTFGPYLVEKGFEALYQKIRERGLGQWLQSEQDYERLEKYAGYVEELLNMCSRLHLALFYIHGLFYHIGKRLAGIRYVMIRYGLATSSQGQGGPQLNTYRILGWLILLQLAIKLYSLISKRFQRLTENREAEENDNASRAGTAKSKTSGLKVVMESSALPESAVQSNIKCPLCLELCRVQTTTPCGHVFCWDCIAEWSSERAECPVCRASSKPQQLVSLQYFLH